MPITPELIAWLDLHENDTLLDHHDGFTTREDILRQAEACAEVEIEEDVSLMWDRNDPNAPYYSYVAISAIPKIAPAVQLDETPLTCEEYIENSPGRLELFRGFLGSNRTESLQLLDLSLRTFGLRAVVTRAPRELWDDALDQVYGSSEAEPHA